MSRCLPFPPPGYERKARNEGEDLLEKEKHREKKHKKEKKDKEKREGKDKREKDKSDGKHREKKDKKEKHKDRDKKDKETDTDKTKDKSKFTDEKRLSGQTEPHSADKLSQKEGKEKSNSVEKKVSGKIGDHKPEKFSQSNNLVNDPKFVKEFGRRIKDDATASGSQLESFSGVDRKKDEGMLRLVARGPSTSAPGREKDKRVEVKTADGQGARDGKRPVGNATVRSTDGIVQNKLEGLPRLVDKNVEKKMEGIEKTNEDKEIDDKRGVKSQENDKEKKSHGKDKDRDREKKREDREKRKEDKQKKKEDKQRKKEDKEKKKEEKAKEKTQLKNSELEEKAKEKPQHKNSEPEEKAKEKPQLKNPEFDKIRGTNKHDLADNHTTKSPQLPKERNSSTLTDGNPKKRKDIETNGVLHAPDNLPSKLLRPTPTSHPPLENGRVLEHCQTTVIPSDKKIVSNNIKVDIKDRRINGVTEAQPPSVSPMKSKPAVAAPADQAKPSVRPPHPDTRYLSLIYSVPKMEDPPDYDDQEWLCGTKPKVDPSGVEVTPMVWAEAQQIASADIFALPYVIPY